MSFDLYARAKSHDSCTQVSAACPVTATTLGYYPVKGWNYFFAIGFGLAGFITLYFGIRKKTWSYMGFIAAGCFLELAGYAARVPLNDNPWNKNAFETQICAIILAPTLICVSIYLTLKHICLNINPALSRVRPTLYPFIFVPADVSCLLIQAIGGALAASAGSDNLNVNQKLLDSGNRAIIAGICLQVVVLAFFGITCIDFFVRASRWIKSGEAGPEAVALWTDRKFRLFVYGVSVAYSCIMIRCIYRIAEMAGGWGSRIMQDEPSFIALEGFMMVIAALCLACFPPGVLFPQFVAAKAAMREQKAALKQEKKERKRARKNGQETPVSGEESQDLEHGLKSEKVVAA